MRRLDERLAALERRPTADGAGSVTASWLDGLMREMYGDAGPPPWTAADQLWFDGFIAELNERVRSAQEASA